MHNNYQEPRLHFDLHDLIDIEIFLFKFTVFHSLLIVTFFLVSQNLLNFTYIS